MYEVKPSNKFKKDLRRVERRGYDIRLINEVIKILVSGKPLPAKYNDHPLKGNHTGLRDCHITPDWLLLYEIDEGKLYLHLTRTGTHSDLKW